MALEEFNNFFTEEELTTKKRNKLDTDIFGIPEERKYPLHDEQHVLSAVTYFNKAEAKYKPELARRIVARAKELNMSWCQWFDKGKSMSGYLKDLPKSYQNEYKNHSDKKQIKESGETKTLSDTPESSDIVIKFAKAGITYDNTGHTGPNKWTLKSPDDIFDKQKANCHDSAYYVFKQLHPKYKCGMLFFIEYNPDTGEAGATHTVCYEKVNGYVVGIELSYEDYGIGTFPFNNVKELAESYARTWVFEIRYNSLLCLDIKDIDGIHPGMTLDQYLKYVMNHSTEVFDKKHIIKEAYDNALSSDEIRHRLDMIHDMTTGTGDYDEHIERDPDDCYTEYTMSNKEYNKLKTDIIDILGKLPTEYHQMLFSYQSTGFIKINRKYVLLDSFKGKHIDDKISIKTLYNPEELYDSLIKDEHKSDMYKIGTLNPDGYIYYKPANQMFYIDKNGERINVGTDKDLFVKMFNESSDINGKINVRMIAGRIHEKYEADKKPPTGNQNCQLCSWCAEAQFRGIDILPRPVYSPRDIALTVDGTKIVENPVKQSFKNMEDMIGYIDKLPNSRWYVHVKWIGGTGGHEFLLLNMNNIPEIMDAQQGVVEPITYMKTFNEYFGNIDWEQSFVCRMDDKPLNDKLLNEMNSMKTFTPWDAKLDIPYMLKEGMLHEDEADEYWRDHPNEAPEKVFTSGDFEKYGKDVNLSDARGPIMHQESYMTFQMLERFVPNSEEGYPDGVWLRPAMKGDRDYITMVEMDTLDDKYKNDPKIQEMIKRDAYESIPRTRIICYTDENNSSRTIGLLQAYQKDDYWYIGEIWLTPEFRGKGIGKSILEKEISKHDWLSLDVNKNNKHAIDLYLSLGFKIVSDNEESYRMDLKKNSTNIQEGAWNDIKNGVNPFSKKQVFHVTKAGNYDGQIFKPRVPDYIGPYDKDDPHFEDSENPRICFSNSIEGALNAILVNIGRWKIADKLDDWYVYIPEKPLKDYKYRTTKQLIKEKKVYDANVTNEIWIEEPVRLKQYGVIHVDQVSDKHTVKTVKSPTGKQSQRSRYDFKWHWLVKPKILKDLPYDYSPSGVCKDIESELWGFKYGLNVDGRLKSGNVSEKDYDDLWRLSSPDAFEEAKGGNCDDYVAWESGYLETYGINTFNKYFIDFGDNHHSFIVVKDNDKYIVIDGAIRHIVPKTDMRKECKSIDECFDYIISSLQKKFKDAKVNNIFDFTKLKIDFGTPMKEYIDYIKSHGKKADYKNTQIKEAWSMDNFERDPSILKMLMESDNEDLSNIEPIEEAANQQFITGFKALRFYLETILKKLGYTVTNDNYKPLIFKIQKDSLTTTIDGSDGKGCKIVTRDLDYHMYPNANGMSLSTAKQVLPGFFKDSEQARTEPIHISKYLNESADETDDDENMNDASLDINIDTDGDGDAIDIGIDTCPTQNQYDPKEIEVLNKLIASEADAISDYFDGSKETRIPVLSKLYSDIGEEERFHIEQLLYAKSTITGEKYEPRDPKVRSEYEELLAMGMDEETAMTTAVDKLSISVSSNNNDEDMSEAEEEEIKENFDMLLTLSKFITLTNDPILESVIETNTVREDLFNEYTNLIDEIFMEEVDNLNRKSSSIDLGSGNPIKMVLGAFRSIYKVIIGLVKRAKTAFLKVRLRDKRRWAWIKKHGIKGLFQNGVYLYFYSDKRNRYEVGQALTFIEIINAMNEKIVKNCKLNVNTSKYNIDGYLKKLSNVEKAPTDKASIIQRIKGNSIEDGMRDLQGMLLQKTKLVVTDTNEAYLEELFFGYTDEKYTMLMNDQEGNEKKVDISMNVYNQLDIALSALEITGNETNVILEELEKQEGQGGIYASNPKVYNTCVKAASMMVKSIQKFVAAMTSDIKTIFDLNRGLKNIVDKIENPDSTKEERKEGKKELDEYNAANKERSDAAKKEIDDRDTKAIKSTKYRTV